MSGSAESRAAVQLEAAMTAGGDAEHTMAPEFASPDLIFPGLLRTLRTREIRRQPEVHPAWNLDYVAGRFVELSNSGCTAGVTAASFLIREAQERGEPAAWISFGESFFYPPDLDESGIDVTALPVIQVPDPRSAARTADKLLRSGGFSLVVLDFDRRVGRNATIPIAQQTRLVGLCHKHRSTLLCLTWKNREAPSLGSLVTLRAEGSVHRTGFREFTWNLQFLKDKRQGPGWSHVEVCRGPTGLS